MNRIYWICTVAYSMQENGHVDKEWFNQMTSKKYALKTQTNPNIINHLQFFSVQILLMHGSRHLCDEIPITLCCCSPCKTQNVKNIKSHRIKHSRVDVKSTSLNRYQINRYFPTEIESLNVFFSLHALTLFLWITLKFHRLNKCYFLNGNVCEMETDLTNCELWRRTNRTEIMFDIWFRILCYGEKWLAT